MAFSYQFPSSDDTDYEQCQKRLGSWEFTCTCLLCIEAKNMTNDVKEKKKGLRADLKEAHNAKGDVVDFQKCERILAQLGKTNIKKSNNAPRLDLCRSYLLLAKSYASLGNPVPVAGAAVKALEMLGFEISDGESGKWSIEVKKWGLVVDYVLECFMFLWSSFALAVNSKGAEDARKYAVMAYKIKFGEDETFDKPYGDAGRQRIARRMSWDCL